MEMINYSSFKLKPIASMRGKMNTEGVPIDFLIDLLNSMGISCADYTEVYKNWPEMFEDEPDRLTMTSNTPAGIGYD